MEHENSISLETFLFGGDLWVGGSPYNSVYIEGFHMLLKKDEHPENFESFESFKKAINYAVSEYAWDLDQMIVCDQSEKKNQIQRFDMPDDETVSEWWQEANEKDDIGD